MTSKRTLLGLLSRPWTSVLVLTGVALLSISYIVERPHASFRGGEYVVDLIQRADGAWIPLRYEPGFLRVAKLRGAITYDDGLGWREWRVERGISLSTPNGPEMPVSSIPGMTAQQLDDAWRSAWQLAIDEMSRPEQAELDRRALRDPIVRAVLLRGCEMLRDGESLLWEGWVYPLRPWLPSVGALLLAFASIRGAIRWWRAGTVEIRRTRLRRGVCGVCEYPFPPGVRNAGVCSECGAILRDSAVGD